MTTSSRSNQTRNHGWGASRFVGHSPSADRVIVVIAYRDLDGDLHGISAWPATGADLRLYQQGDDDGQDD